MKKNTFLAVSLISMLFLSPGATAVHANAINVEIFPGEVPATTGITETPMSVAVNPFAYQEAENLGERFQNSYYEDEQIQITASKNQLKLSGIIASQQRWLMVSIKNSSGTSRFTETYRVNSDGTYEITLSPRLSNGQYTLDIFAAKGQYDRYQGLYWGLPLSKGSSGFSFSLSPVYEDNLAAFNLLGEPTATDTVMVTQNQHERTALEAQAEEIVKDMVSDHEKMVAINDWVSENIYYNYDNYYSGSYGRTDAYGTLQSRRSVCQGYAELTNELLRAAGIPARVVSGHARGVSANGKSWEELDHSQSNHAWNVVFVDGRWRLLDTTWNTHNKYQDGREEPGRTYYKYFDPTLAAFSLTHKLIP